MNKFTPYDNKAYVGLAGYGLGGLNIKYEPTLITCTSGIGQTLFLLLVCSIFSVAPMIAFYFVEDFREELLDFYNELPWLAIIIIIFLSFCIFATLKIVFRRPKITFNKISKKLSLSCLSSKQENFVVSKDDVEAVDIILKPYTDSDGDRHDNFVLMLATRHGDIQLCISEDEKQLKKLADTLKTSWGI